jgi:nucleotide-binding universal stress UspA family protein
MKLLVAIDATPASKALISALLSRPWPADTAVRLLYVKKSLSLSSDFVDVESYVEYEHEVTNSFVEQMASSLLDNGLSVSTAIVKGRPQKIIVRDAAQWGADLILVAAEDNEKRMRPFSDRVARAVMRTAPCSVEIVRDRMNQVTQFE